MIRRIIKTTDNLTFLHAESKELDDFDLAKQIVKDLVDTANASEIPAVGLAAIQIAIPYRVFIVKYDEKWQEIINPEITYHSKARIAIKEECLSVPDKAVRVLRYKKITIQGMNQNGEPISFNFSDFYSIVAQHELDHLNGKLICDYIPAVAKR